MNPLPSLFVSNVLNRGFAPGQPQGSADSDLSESDELGLSNRWLSSPRDREEAAVDPLSNAYAYALPSELRPTTGSGQAPAYEVVEERWPIGLSAVFIVNSAILLWLPVIAGIRWLLGYA